MTLEEQIASLRGELAEAQGRTRDLRTENTRLTQELRRVKLSSRVEVSEILGLNIDLRRQIELDKVAVLKAELLQAEIDEALGEAGYVYPQGIQGIRDLINNHQYDKGIVKAARQFFAAVELLVDTLELDSLGPGVDVDQYRAYKEVVAKLNAVLDQWRSEIE